MALGPQILTGVFTLAGAVLGGFGAIATAKVSADRQDSRERWRLLRDERRKIIIHLIHRVDEAYKLAQEVYWATEDGIVHKDEMPAEVSNSLLEAVHAVRTDQVELFIAGVSPTLVQTAESLMEAILACHQVALQLVLGRRPAAEHEATWEQYRQELDAIGSSRDAYQRAARDELKG